MRHTIPHDLGIDLARRATRKALETYRENLSDYETRGKWVSEDHATVQFTVLGRTLKGTVDVRQREVQLQLDVPFLFRAFQGVAMKVVQDEIERWLEAARRGEL